MKKGICICICGEGHRVPHNGLFRDCTLSDPCPWPLLTWGPSVCKRAWSSVCLTLRRGNVRFVAHWYHFSVSKRCQPSTTITLEPEHRLQVSPYNRMPHRRPLTLPMGHRGLQFTFLEDAPIFSLPKVPQCPDTVTLLYYSEGEHTEYGS